MLVRTLVPVLCDCIAGLATCRVMIDPEEAIPLPEEPDAALYERLAIKADQRTRLTLTTAGVCALHALLAIYILSTSSSSFIGSELSTGSFVQFLGFCIAMAHGVIYFLIIMSAYPLDPKYQPNRLFPPETRSSPLPSAVTAASLLALFIWVMCTGPNGLQEKQGVKDWPLFYPSSDRSTWFVVSLILFAILSAFTGLYALAIPGKHYPTVHEPLGRAFDPLLKHCEFRGKYLFARDGSRPLLILFGFGTLSVINGLVNERARLYLGSGVIAMLAALGGLMGIRADLILHD